MSAKRKSFPNKISSQIDDQMKIDEDDDDYDHNNKDCQDTDNDDDEPDHYRLNGAPLPDNGTNNKNNYLLMASEMSNTDSEYESESSGHSSKSADGRRKMNKRSIDEVLNRLNKNNNHCKKRSVVVTEALIRLSLSLIQRLIVFIASFRGLSNNSAPNLVQNLASLCADGDPQVVTQTERKLNEMIQQLSQLRENILLKQHEVKTDTILTHCLLSESEEAVALIDLTN